MLGLPFAFWCLLHTSIACKPCVLAMADSHVMVVGDIAVNGDLSVAGKLFAETPQRLTLHFDSGDKMWYIHDSKVMCTFAVVAPPLGETWRLDFTEENRGYIESDTERYWVAASTTRRHG